MSVKFDLNSDIFSYDNYVYYVIFTVFLSQFGYSLLSNISFDIEEDVCFIIVVTFVLILFLKK